MVAQIPVSAHFRALVPDFRKKPCPRLPENSSQNLPATQFGGSSCEHRGKESQEPGGGRELGPREALPVRKEPGHLAIIDWMIGLALSGYVLALQGGMARGPSQRPLSRAGTTLTPVQPLLSTVSPAFSSSPATSPLGQSVNSQHQPQSPGIICIFFSFDVGCQCAFCRVRDRKRTTDFFRVTR